MLAQAIEQSPNYDFVENLIEAAHKAPLFQALELYQRLKHPNVDRWAVAELGRRDRFFLLTHILSQTFAIHPFVYARCREIEAEPDNCLDLWSRYHFKTTVGTFAGSIQEILKNPEIAICIFSFKRPIAKGFLNQIKREFESNDMLKALYPEICYSNPDKESPKWSEDEGLIVKRRGNRREATLEAYGLVDGMPTSRHYDLRIYDDIVTEKSVTTPEQITKTNDRLELSYALGTEDGGREQFFGTRYAYNDTWQFLLDRGRIIPRIYPATDNGLVDGKPIMLSQQAWDDVVAKTSLRTIACQYLQNPLAGAHTAFDPAWIRRYEVRPTIVNAYLLVDPARSRKKTSDRTAMGIILVDTFLNRYLADGACHRMSLSERWEMMWKLYAKWRRQPGVQSVKVGYERYGAEADIDYFKEQQQRMTQRTHNQCYFQIHELVWKRDGPDSHTDRVNRLEPDLKEWRWYFPYKGQETSMQREFREAGKGAYIAKPIIQRNEDGELYDVTEWMINNEYKYYPAIHVDFLDMMSRISDIEIAAPTLKGSVLPPREADY